MSYPEPHPAGWTVQKAPGNVSPPPARYAGQAAAQADSTAATLAALVADFNALLAKLRAAGLMAS